MMVLDTNKSIWWYWLISSVCLWLAVSFYPAAYAWTIAITVVQLIHFRITEGSFSNFKTQVRIAFLVVLLLALPEATRWFLWVIAAGATIRVSTGYCFLARTLSLLPFNREVNFSWRLVKKAYLTPPTQGSITNNLSLMKENA